MAYFKCAFSNSGATLTVECDSFMAGAIVTCSNGVKTLQGLCPSTSPYEVTFKIPEEGTWVVSTTISGATYSTSVDIDFSFEASLSGFNWMRWLTEGGLDPSDYNDLSEVLADEKALRQLNLVHASVDYMASILATHPDVETIIAEGLFAKWANHSDYALDHMEANAVLSDLMDDADLYGYGELVFEDNEWKPKGNVPVMTSNSAPYGEAFTGTNGQNAYRAFDGVESDATLAYVLADQANSDSNFIGYHFPSPTIIRRIKLKLFNLIPNNYTPLASNYKVQVSNDNSSWSDVFEGNISNDVNRPLEYDIELSNTQPYFYYRIWFENGLAWFTTSQSQRRYFNYISMLQFYGRELKVSVPTMTSRTAPYGNILAPTDLAANTAAWHAFDGGSYCWNYNALHTIGYEFVRPAVVNMLGIKNRQDTLAAPPKKFNLVGSNDGGTTWETVLANLECNNTTFGAWMFFDISNTTPYKAYGIEVTEMQSNTVWINEIAFYGKDYTEKEFANDGSKWLYDHGVELETFEEYKGDASCVARKDSDELYCETKATSAVVSWNASNDMSGYSKLFCKVGQHLVTGADNIYFGIRQTPSSTLLAYKAFNAGSDRLLALDISGFNGTYYAQVSASYINKIMSCQELWLE